MIDLGIAPVTELVEELKRRDLTFIIAWADHQQFTKRDTDIVWALDHAGNLPLKLTLLRLLTNNLNLFAAEKVTPGTTTDD